MIIFRLLLSSTIQRSHWVTVSSCTWKIYVISESPILFWLVRHFFLSEYSSSCAMNSDLSVPSSKSFGSSSPTLSLTQSMREVIRFCWTRMNMIFPSFASQRPKSRNVAIMPSYVSLLSCAIPSGGLISSATILLLLALAMMPHHPGIMFVEITIFSFLLIYFFLISSQLVSDVW